MTHVINVPFPENEVVCDMCNELFERGDKRTGGGLVGNSWAACPECITDEFKSSGDFVPNPEGQTFFDFIEQVRNARESADELIESNLTEQAFEILSRFTGQEFTDNLEPEKYKNLIAVLKQIEHARSHPSEKFHLSSTDLFAAAFQVCLFTKKIPSPLRRLALAVIENKKHSLGSSALNELHPDIRTAMHSWSHEKAHDLEGNHLLALAAILTYVEQVNG